MHDLATHLLRRVGAVLFATLCLISAAHAQGVAFGPGLLADLEALDAADQLGVIVTFDQEAAPTPAQLDAVRALGITRGLAFRSLPVMGLLATPAQVRALARLDGVRSIWPNRRLTYYNGDARALTGVDRLRADARLRTAQGLPFSGRGIGVVVNDSGVDGSLPDLAYGENLVENVQGITNLNALHDLLPVTYTEGLINTDLGSGHGTHVAGTVGGTGVSSDGRHAGVAPGADLIGYGSGAVLFVLDALGGFDYALTHQFDRDHAPIRIITNSWGTTGAFEPNDPVNVASHLAYQRGITVLFAAGNEGPGEDTHNPYAVAPWVISVGAGDKDGRLADFSSRGLAGDTGTFQAPDGQTWTYVNAPTVVAPGVRIISARATTGVLPLLEAEGDLNALGADAAFYTHMDGTSMATPHVAGIVALMLEARPQLQPAEVKQILTATATNMPGRATWEVGAGYVNAYAAVTHALGLRTDYGRTLNATRPFNSHAVVHEGGQQTFTLSYDPILAFEDYTFEVPPHTARIKATATVQSVAGVAANSIALVLYGPNGEQAGSGLTLPLLGGDRASVSVDDPAPGTWRVTARGIGSVAGLALDPLGLTNGYALPEEIDGTLRFFEQGSYEGLSDIEGHPAATAIRFGVRERLVDGLPNGRYRPDAPLKRAQMAEYLVMGAGIRQHLPLDGRGFGDVTAETAPFAAAVTAHGAALRDQDQRADGVMRAAGGTFDPDGRVTRVDLAYALVQSLGLQAFARSFAGDVTAPYGDRAVPVVDAGTIPEGMRGYVFAALHLGLMHATFELEQGPFDLQPEVRARFYPAQYVTRGAYAVSASRYLDVYETATRAVPGADGTTSGRTAQAGVLQQEAALAAEVPGAFALEQNYPNPFNPATQIRFTLPEAGLVRLAVYDVMGRTVRVLIDGRVEAGTHAVRFAAGELASGTYLYRLETPARTVSRQMILMK